MIAFVIQRGFNIFCFLDEGQDKKWIKYLLSQNMPVLIPVGYLRYGHMVVLVGYDDNKKIFHVADPEWRSIQKQPYQEFNEWHDEVQEGNEAFLVYPEFKQIEALSGGKTPTELKKYSNIKGIAYLKKGQYDRAISNFNKALEIEPELARVYINRGAAYMGKGQYEEAISDFTKAIEINPRYAITYYGRGVAYYYKKEYDKSWEDINKALALGYEIPPNFLNELRKASGREK